VLIFDEVITGFRVHPGGAQAWFGVKADIATYGKIIGGGLPIGVIAGAHTFMDAFDGGSWQYGDASVPEAGVTFFAGTFVRHPLAMAAAQAVLHHLRTEGPELQRALNERTARFTGEVNTFLEAEGIDLKINHFGSLWYFSHGEGFKYFSLMFHFLRDLGIHIWEGRPCFLSTAHSEADVARLVDGFKRAIAAMREGGFLTERVAPVSADGPFPLTEAQQEIWLAERLDATAAPAFNESCSLTFRGALNRVALETALRQVVERHEALRTTVDASGEQQRVQLPTAPDLLFADLTGVNEREREQRLSELVRDEVRRPFDLARAPLLRGRLIQLEPSLHVLVLTAHHIVCDGWSYDVMSRDVGELYSLVCKGQRDQRPAPMQFRDYARWMAAYRREARYDTDLTYWTRLLASPPQAVQLPTDQARSPVRTFQGAMEVAMVEGPLCSALKELGMRKRCTQFSTLLAVYAVLLHRLTGQSDLIIGIPAAGQQLVEGQDLVGHCANLLPLRLSLTSDQTFADVMAQAQQALLDAYEHQGLTFGALLKSLQLPRDPSRAPLIQVTFNVDPAIHGLDFEGLETSIVINPRTAYQFEHSLNIVVQPDGLRLECNYNTGLFGATTAARWLGHFREIARAVAETSELTVAEIPLLSADEQKVQLLDWNQTTTPYPSSACIHELFEQEVRVHPDRIALSLSGKTITYRDLNRLANQLARKLIALGIVADQPVGICTERSLDMVIGLLGILKAGGAYLPLDPTHPPERLRLQLTDADVKVSVVQGKFAPLLADQDVQRVVLDDESADWRTLADDDVALSVQSSQLAYVLFTSGSTGQPKGVLIEHRSVVRLVKGSNFMTWNPDDRMLQHSPLAFDASTLELWGPLLNGCCMALLPPGPFTYQALAKAIREERVTKLWLTGSVFHQVADDYPDSLAPVKHLLAGGEVLSGVRIERLLRQRPDLLITNGYGPTESTTFATTETFTGSDRVDDPPPLGRPISNTQVYVLDERLQPVPVGVTGELCIGGDGLARGYLKRPELTRQVFVPNPFPGTPGDRLYRTGDLARYRANGKLEFLGRRDNQVKIRGFRIEPGEVESVLSTYPGLRNCAVIVRVAANGEKQLAAYLAMKDGEPSPEVAALRTHLLRALPDYMMPTVISVLPSLPLTSSGKVDRNHLSDPVASSRSTADVQTEPTSALADMVAAIWADVLNLPHVNQRDDFFALGGHSLAALKMIDRLREAGYELEVADLFRHSTVEAVVKVMKQLRGAPLETTQGDAVVRLKDGRADLAPLCLLPSDFGDLLIYTNLLPLLAPDQPCIGLQSPRIFERDEGIASMTDYAAFFVRQLRSVQPKGPYLLAGYCFGGLVAMEMAKQLMAAGQTIGLLALIDARPFSPLVERSERLLMLLQGALRASVSDWKRHLAAKWSMKREAMLINWMATKNPEKLSRRDYNRWMLETKVLANYRSTEYDGAITYFYPEESQYQLYDDPTCGWLNMAERVSLYKVSGSHLNMMKEPHVRLLAEQLQACIRRANGT
jgi:amino acid adenylation domain-containing protein